MFASIQRSAGASMSAAFYSRRPAGRAGEYKKTPDGVAVGSMPRSCVRYRALEPLFAPAAGLLPDAPPLEAPPIGLEPAAAPLALPPGRPCVPSRYSSREIEPSRFLSSASKVGMPAPWLVETDPAADPAPADEPDPGAGV